MVTKDVFKEVIGTAINVYSLNAVIVNAHHRLGYSVYAKKSPIRSPV